MSGIVFPSRVGVGLAAASRDEVVRAVIELLRGDPRIGPLETFITSIGPKQVVDLKGEGCGVCLAHGRDTSVKELALAAGRLAAPLGPEGLRLVFVFAIPATMAGEYLRTVGALARACGNAKKVASLLDAADAEKFAAVLNALLT